MRLSTVIRGFKTFKAVAELAYLFGYKIGSRRKK